MTSQPSELRERAEKDARELNQRLNNGRLAHENHSRCPECARERKVAASMFEQVRREALEEAYTLVRESAERELVLRQLESRLRALASRKNHSP